MGSYRDASSVLHAGQVFVTHSYDGKGRRITKDVRDAGGLGDGVWRWYYDNDSVIEVRDGGFQPAKQYVWGTRYVDELVQVMSQMVLGLDPMDLDPDYVLTGETTYHYDSSGARGSAYTGIYTIGKPMWACQDANYNVLGVINGDGVLRERYTYTPYGERQAFRSAGAADVGDFSPLFASEREAFGSDPYNNFPMLYGVCDVGHQGLIHDEESGLVHNRSRMLETSLCGFVQRDSSVAWVLARHPIEDSQTVEMEASLSSDAFQIADAVQAMNGPSRRSDPSYSFRVLSEVVSDVDALRASKPALAYGDGMDLYQYERSDPIRFSDSNGLAVQTVAYSCNCGAAYAWGACTCTSGRNALTLRVMMIVNEPVCCEFSCVCGTFSPASQPGAIARCLNTSLSSVVGTAIGFSGCTCW